MFVSDASVNKGQSGNTEISGKSTAQIVQEIFIRKLAMKSTVQRLPQGVAHSAACYQDILCVLKVKPMLAAPEHVRFESGDMGDQLRFQLCMAMFERAVKGRRQIP